jgi:glycosyltransferase involved in cell wall biosynthesis
MPKIKVMHVYNSLFDGGIEKYILMIFDALDKEKFECSVCCLIERGSHAEIFESHGYKVYELQATNSQSVKGLFKNLIEIYKLFKLMRKNQTDIVHSHDFFPATLARLAARLAGIKTIFITLHNTFTWLKPLHYRINRWLAKRTTKIICVSKSVERFSKATDKIRSEKYLTIYNGINTTHYTPDDKQRNDYRNDFGILPSEIVIGSIGAFSFRKGHKYLVDAFCELCKVHSNLKLILVGSERPQEPEIKPELESLIQHHGIANKVIFTGTRNDAVEVINAFDIFVMSSVVEGFGFALIEGMLMAKPLVCSDIDVFKELVEDGKTGVFFQSRNSKDIMNKIAFVLEHPQLAQHIAQNARQHVLEHYDQGQMLAAYKDLYEKHTRI